MSFDAGAIVGKLILDSKDFAAKMTSAKSATNSFASNFKYKSVDVTKAFLGITGSATAFFYASKKLTDIAADAQRKEMAVADAMRLRGVYTEKAYQDTLKYAEVLQSQSVYDDEQIKIVQELLIRRGAQGEQLKELTRVTLDFASAQRMDLASAGDLVGKTIGSETNALGRYGIEVEGAVGSTERMTETVKGLSELYGGRAAMDANTYAGKQAILKNRFGDLQETIGYKLLPAFEGLQNAGFELIKTADDVTKSISDLDEESNVFVDTAKWMIKGGIGVIATFDILETRIASVGHSFYQAGQVISKAWKVISKPLDKQAAAELKTAWEDIAWTTIPAVDKAILKWAETFNKIDAAFLNTTKKSGQSGKELKGQAQELEEIGILESSLEFQKAGEIIDAAYENMKIGDLSADWQKQIDFMEEFEDLMPDITDQIKSWAEVASEDLMAPVQTIGMAKDAVQGYYDLKAVKIQNDLANELTTAEQEYLAKKSYIEQNVIDEEERMTKLGELEEAYAAQKQNISDVYRKKELEARKKMKPLLIAEAVANTSLGVTKALASGFPPWNFIQAALVAAQGGFQVATIRAQQFALGGEMKSRGIAMVGERGPEIVELPAGARIHTAQESKTFAREIKITIHNTIQALDPSSVTDASVERLIQRIVSPLKAELAR